MKADKQSRQVERRQIMLTQPIGSVIIKMSIPTIVAFLINSIYSLADTYFVSGLGTQATAAVSVNASLDQLIMMCGSMLAVGANSYIARLLGQGKDKRASQVLSTAFFLAAGFGTLLMIFGTIFMEEMVTLLGATPTCLQYSMDYASYVLLAAPFMASNFVMNQCLRSEGSATLSMIGMGFGGILNCFLDPVFIQGVPALGLPAMGVAGASLATAISKLVSFAILLFPYVTRKTMLRLSIRNFHPAKDIVGQIVSIGSSSMFRSGLAVVAGILLNELAGNISDSVLAGIGVTTKIMMFPFSIILGFGTGFQPVAGFNWGARRYDRVLESYRFSSRVSLIGSAVMAVLLICLADPIITAFAGTDPEMHRIGALCIRLQCIALPVHSWVSVVNMLCAGLGNAKGAFALATSRQGSCFLPILFPLAYLAGDYGLACVQAAADILSLALAIPIIIHMLRMIRSAQAKADYIAVFDSGVGGISVLRELKQEMPGENYLYFGDSANAPYGTRSTREVRLLTMDAAEKLLARGVKALVIACNTATTAAINDLREAYPDTIIVGIEPALKLAADHFPNGRVGVMATPVTLQEEKFHNLAHRFPNMQVSPIPVPGLVERIEAGCEEDELEAFLRPVLEEFAGNLDALVLGCTHYPFAAQVIRKILGQNTALLDGGAGTARETRRRLQEKGLLLEGEGSVRIENSSTDPRLLARCTALLEAEDIMEAKR